MGNLDFVVHSYDSEIVFLNRSMRVSVSVCSSGRMLLTSEEALATNSSGRPSLYVKYKPRRALKSSSII